MVNKTTTGVSKIKFNRLTNTQFKNNISTLSTEEIYLVDPQFTGGKLLATDSNGDIVETNITPSVIDELETALHVINSGSSS